jgi:hypothetical protein
MFRIEHLLEAAVRVHGCILVVVVARAFVASEQRMIERGRFYGMISREVIIR